MEISKTMAYLIINYIKKQEKIYVGLLDIGQKYKLINEYEIAHKPNENVIAIQRAPFSDIYAIILSRHVEFVSVNNEEKEIEMSHKHQSIHNKDILGFGFGGDSFFTCSVEGSTMAEIRMMDFKAWKGDKSTKEKQFMKIEKENETKRDKYFSGVAPENG